MPKKKQPIAERFWSKVKFGLGCWEWQGSTPPPGYGRFWINGRYDGAHRVAWLLFHGPIPDGLLVCHHCDNPSCVRPDHLFIGTVQDNSDDMVRKGRQNRDIGEDANSAKLETDDVFEMRRRYQLGETAGLIAKDFKVTETAVTAAITGKCWGHLPGHVSMGHAKGERHARAKMTSSQVISYRRRYADGEMPQSLADEAGVCHRVMMCALTGKTWKHLPGAFSRGSSRGEFAPQSKLSDALVRDAHSRICGGALYVTIAKEIGVSDVALSNAVRGKTWKHLNLPPITGKRMREHRQHGTKLTDDEVREMRSLRVAGVSIAEIANRFGIHRGTASAAISGKTWRHVD